MFVRRASRPTGKPCWSPTHDALSVTVHDAFPPLNLNLQTVKRHEGAKDGALITQEHDWAMVDCIFGSSGPL